MVTRDFAACLETYDRLVPFQRSGQSEWHQMTIEARLRCGTVQRALDDEAFPRIPAAHVRPGRAASRIGDSPDRDPALDVPAVCEHIWQVIENLGIVRNRSLIVAGIKALHHILPGLVPPMDRAWAGASFLRSAAAPQYAQSATLTRAFTGLAQVARAVKPSGYTGKGWRTSRSKVLDNAIIGYCKLNNIEPVRG